MGQMVSVFNGVSGINAKYDPATLATFEGGAAELSEAVNVVVTDRGRVERRSGFTQRVATGGHSLFSCRNGTFFVNGTTLYALDGSSTNAVLAGLSGNRVAYVSILDTVYFSDGVYTGKINGGTYSAWEADSYTGERQQYYTVAKNLYGLALADYNELTNGTESNSQAILTSPPAGNHLCWYKSRIYIGNGKFVFYTEPWLYDWYCVNENWRAFPDEVKMVSAVDDGVYVAAGGSLFFLGGNHPREAQMLHVVDADVIEGTDVVCDGSLLGSGEASGLVSLVATTDGVIALLGGGQYAWMTRNKHERINALTGSAVVHDGRYICMIDP